MRKKWMVLLLTGMMVTSTGISASAATDGMVVTQLEKGITEGVVEEECVIVDGMFYSKDKARAAYVDIVGINEDDMGPWEHGVLSTGIVYSNYTNRKFWHGSSAQGSSGLDRSDLVAPNRKSQASISTIWTDGNRAFWRVDETKG